MSHSSPSIQRASKQESKKCLHDFLQYALKGQYLQLRIIMHPT
jgi:hypothetical protein